ncbi:hypothetical protein [Phenylobacterium sp.]|uniref:hypothetical protein n=1 Tax=Phenylobacterium sp. TaxID=1871053 RepID=UPI0008D132A6|nr:hypothetical protein [Phenylobacterium sp.]MBA4793580.1 hypothetical protein [Phenylobacterium sp.]MBC7166574.1 hypothetical protein [Phenylobacterium sp.]OHB40950.1 MAG: hypothetical protein A2882_04380 [Phenylobacterium sp. RIFCSPHIGHO2_01_FULL_70_10]
MIARIAALALVAAASVSAPAFAAEGVKVSLSGKSAEQVHAEIVGAARTVCLRETTHETFRQSAQARCVKSTVEATLQKVGDSELAAVAGIELAQR